MVWAAGGSVTGEEPNDADAAQASAEAGSISEVTDGGEATTARDVSAGNDPVAASSLGFVSSGVVLAAAFFLPEVRGALAAGAVAAVGSEAVSVNGPSLAAWTEGAALVRRTRAAGTCAAGAGDAFRPARVTEAGSVGCFEAVVEALFEMTFAPVFGAAFEAAFTTSFVSFPSGVSDGSFAEDFAFGLAVDFGANFSADLEADFEADVDADFAEGFPAALSADGVVVVSALSRAGAGAAARRDRVLVAMGRWFSLFGVG